MHHLYVYLMLLFAIIGAIYGILLYMSAARREKMMTLSPNENAAGRIKHRKETGKAFFRHGTICIVGVLLIALGGIIAWIGLAVYLAGVVLLFLWLRSAHHKHLLQLQNENE